MSPQRLRPAPWHELSLLIGTWLAVLTYVLPLALVGPIARALGGEPQFRDVGDAFTKAAEIARYADLALARVAAGNPLPPPPQLLGDPIAARIAWSMAILSSAAFLLVPLVAGRQPPGAFARAVGLQRFQFERLWLPGALVAVSYPLVSLYAAIVSALGWHAIAPATPTLDATLRDPAALALYGIATVIAAPLSEEAFFRGFLFSGALSWGFWPAAGFSALLFALAHTDAGAVIPFFLIGLLIAWLYWRTGCLWDAIAFHVLFNGLSFILLVTRY